MKFSVFFFEEEGKVHSFRICLGAIQALAVYSTVYTYAFPNKELWNAERAQRILNAHTRYYFWLPFLSFLVIQLLLGLKNSLGNARESEGKTGGRSALEGANECREIDIVRSEVEQIATIEKQRERESER